MQKQFQGQTKGQSQNKKIKGGIIPPFLISQTVELYFYKLKLFLIYEDNFF